MAAAILDNATYTAASSVTTRTLPGPLNWHQQCVNLSDDKAIRQDVYHRPTHDTNSPICNFRWFFVNLAQFLSNDHITDC